jgi:thiol-disulfide isomerase/thioredoxin
MPIRPAPSTSSRSATETEVTHVSTIGGTRSTAVDAEQVDGSFELFDGGEATFAGYRGEPLVINLWAPWCPACVAELLPPAFTYEHQPAEPVDAALIIRASSATDNSDALPIDAALIIRASSATDNSDALPIDAALIIRASSATDNSDALPIDAALIIRASSATDNSDAPEVKVAGSMVAGSSLPVSTRDHALSAIPVAARVASTAINAVFR